MEKTLPLTEKEQQVFDFILSYVVKNGHSPLKREIGAELGITPQGADRHIKSLERKGRIEVLKFKGQRTVRNIVIVDKFLAGIDSIV